MPIRFVHLVLQDRRKRLSPYKDYMFATLTQLERDLVNFVSRVQNLKLAAATTDNHKYPI